MNLYNLVAKLTLDDSEYKQKLEENKRVTEEHARQTEKNIGVIAANAWANLASLIVKAGQKIKEITVDLINYADQYSDLSSQYDISTKSLQQFEYIASQSSTTLQSLLSSMTMMYNRAKENDDVFSRLGVSVKDVNGNMKSMDTLFWEVKEALDNVTNSGDKSALMLEVFGRNAMQNGEVLRKSSEELRQMAQRAEDVGIILDEKTIQSASNFNDMLAEMRLRGKSAFADFLSGATGADKRVSEFMNEILKTVNDYMPRIQEIGEQLGWTLLKAMANIVWNNAKRLFLVSIGKGWLWGREENQTPAEDTSPITDMEIMPSNSYEVNERSSSTIELKVSAVGDTEISNANAELIARNLVPYIDKALGEV